MSNVAETDWVEKIGAPAFESIREMVAALGCDYDRLEELREAKADFEVRSVNGSAEPCPSCGVGSGEDHTEECEGGDHKLVGWEAEHPDDADELKELEDEAGECKDADEARERILEDALSVEVRSGWVSLGSQGADMTPEEFNILITTGGPAVRIMGDLANGEPHRAWLEVQDWGKPWTEYFPASIDGAAVLLSYARCFCFEC
jgi:hypothetical protein